MNWQGLEYSLNAIYYCIWLKNLWMQKTAEKFTKFLLLSLPKPFLPKRYYEKLKKHVTKNLEEGHDNFYDKRDGVCIDVTKFDADSLFIVYSCCIALPVSLGAYIYIIDQMWIAIPVILVITYIFEKPLSKYVYRDDKYLKYFKEFENEDKAWRRKWKAITLLFCLGALLSFLLGLAAAKFVALSS